ncbi:MAG: beta-Ig-H3/fasciclin [Chloroflexi bacterium]|nr:MAG: beta-Ig-H3/fasciclin [Chloroflexota bacterium]
MSRLMKSITLTVLVLILAVPFVFADGHESTIVDIAAGSEDFDTLTAAVKAAGLDASLSEGSWTVFAPTDEAFAKLGLDASNVGTSFTKAELTDLLLYHVLTEPVSSEEAKANHQGNITMGNGQIAGLKYFDGSLYMNDDAKIITPDLQASNGVIHVVDNVILPPWPRTEDAPHGEISGNVAAPAGSNTIVDIAVNDGRFDTLAAAVAAADLVDTLSSGSWTVFAPTDDAFAKLGLDETNIAAAYSKEELADILLYHVLTKPVSTEEAKVDQGDIVMGNNQLAGLKFFDGSLYINDDSKIIIQDIQADNGVIHVVDTVILGPWPRDAQ